jgi:hypothetical protein
MYTDGLPYKYFYLDHTTGGGRLTAVQTATARGATVARRGRQHQLEADPGARDSVQVEHLLRRDRLTQVLLVGDPGPGVQLWLF